MGAMGMPYGLQAMLKEGHKHFSGLDEAVYKNIEAGKQLSQIARTSMGPNGKKYHLKHIDGLICASRYFSLHLLHRSLCFQQPLLGLQE